MIQGVEPKITETIAQARPPQTKPTQSKSASERREKCPKISCSQDGGRDSPLTQVDILNSEPEIGQEQVLRTYLCIPARRVTEVPPEALPTNLISM